LNGSSIFERIEKVAILKEKYKSRMSLLWSKSGFRGEYLAKFIVSRFAFISESSVGEDYGVDFYCGLIKDARNKDYVHYDKPFLLQIKTKTKEGVVKADVVYDTQEKIETLCSLNLPFFIGYLDSSKQKLEIFSTSSMWHAFLVDGPLNVHRIVFKFRKNNDVHDVGVAKKDKIDLKGIKNLGTKYTIDLGHPIASISINELDSDENKIENIRNILSKCIDREFDNITNKRLGLYYYRWVHKYTTNDPAIGFGYNFLGKDDTDDLDTQNAINSMNHYLISLAVSFKENGDDINYKNACRLTKLISEDARLDSVIKAFPEIYGLPKNKKK